MPTSSWSPLADRLKRTLGLAHAPIAITFSDDAPANLPAYEDEMPPPSADGRTGRVPAGCVFWIRSQERTFTTVPEDHYNCSVGSVTHGLKSLDDVMKNEDVQRMVECEWVTPEVARQLPVITRRPRYIIYGPLAESAVDPDVVLLRISPFQAMMLHDAFDDLVIVGRPQCHIIPIAKGQNQVAMSTGCMLSRVRTGMLPSEMTCTIPAKRLGEVVNKLEARQQADTAVSWYANMDSRRFPGSES